MAQKFKDLEQILNEIRQMPAFNPPQKAQRTEATQPQAKIEPPVLQNTTFSTPASAPEQNLAPTLPAKKTEQIEAIDQKFREEVKRNQELYKQKKQKESAQKIINLLLKAKTKTAPQKEESPPPSQEKTAPPPAQAQVTSSFGIEDFMKRKIVTPFGTYRKKEYPDVTFWNPGITILAKEGEGIKTPASGTVLVAKHIRGYGPTVLIKTDSGEAILFSGLSKNLPVKAGDRVNAGDIIGVIHGGSGMHGDWENNQPVLQFEVWAKNKQTGKYDAYDPISYLQTKIKQVAKGGI